MSVLLASVGTFVPIICLAPKSGFAVLDEYQGLGIGTLLLKHLAAIARRNGISEFAADVLGTNHQMLEVFANSGLSFHDSYECGVVRVTLNISI